MITLLASAVLLTQVAPQVTVVFSGGMDLDPRDGGRPVTLIAGALGVPGDIFRAAFTQVSPAPGGREPDPAQVQRNKKALLAALSKYGVTNERLDTVSDYYRYRPQAGEHWPSRPARARAILARGLVTGFEVLDGGFGYSSEPVVTVTGVRGVRAKAVVSYGTDLKSNGSVVKVVLVK